MEVQEYIKVKKGFKGILLPNAAGTNLKIKQWHFGDLFLSNQA